MSVLVHERSEYGRIAWTLQHRPFSEGFMDSEEHNRQKVCYASDPDGYRELLIVTWADRLFIANQMSYCYSYNEAIEFERLDKDDVKGPAFTPSDLRKALRGIQYNICTNGGNEFLGGKDAEKLRHVIELASDAVIDGRQTETGLLG